MEEMLRYGILAMLRRGVVDVISERGFRQLLIRNNAFRDIFEQLSP